MTIYLTNKLIIKANKGPNGKAAVKKLTTELNAKLVAKLIVPFVIVLNKDITEAEPVKSIEGEVPVKTWLAVVNNE